MGLEQKAIQRIKTASEMSLHHYGKPLVCTYSGGKDSDVMMELFKRSGVPFEVLNNHTTADAPQTVRHIRKVFKKCEDDGIDCRIEYPYVNGEFKKMSAPYKMWMSLTKDIASFTKPQLFYYMKDLIGRWRERLFDFDGKLYCSIESEREEEIETPEWADEMKASEFYKILEESEE